MRPKGMKASDFWERRTKLIEMIDDIDEQIYEVLSFRGSKRAAERAKDLFILRSRIAERLSKFGVEVDDHPALYEEVNYGDQV
jgi:Zn-dependent oligopeptidase